MFYLYLDGELISQSELFSEIADIIFVEILKDCQCKFELLDKLLIGLLEHHYGSFYVPGFTSLVEVYHGRNS